MTQIPTRILATGDILYQQVPGRIRDFETYSNPGDTIIIAEGERSGHAHVVRGTGASLYHDLDAEKNIPPGLYIGTLVVTDQPVTLTHEEHAPITLPPNTFWVVRRQREQSAAPEHWRFRLAND